MRAARPQNTRTVIRLAGVAVFMGGLAWASVPLYDWFCRVTGFGGTPGRSAVAAGDILDRTVTIRFDASQERGFPWEFKPVVRTMELPLGQIGLAFYEAYNPTTKPVAGTAAFNVFPYQAGGYFTKIACFCFEEQVLHPGERVRMPVTFYVDPEMVADRDAKHIHAITLSYTFYEIDLPTEPPVQESRADMNMNMKPNQPPTRKGTDHGA